MLAQVLTRIQRHKYMSIFFSPFHLSSLHIPTLLFRFLCFLFLSFPSLFRLLPHLSIPPFLSYYPPRFHPLSKLPFLLWFSLVAFQLSDIARSDLETHRTMLGLTQHFPHQTTESFPPSLFCSLQHICWHRLPNGRMAKWETGRQAHFSVRSSPQVKPENCLKWAAKGRSLKSFQTYHLEIVLNSFSFNIQLLKNTKTFYP